MKYSKDSIDHLFDNSKNRSKSFQIILCCKGDKLNPYSKSCVLFAEFIVFENKLKTTLLF